MFPLTSYLLPYTTLHEFFHYSTSSLLFTLSSLIIIFFSLKIQMTKYEKKNSISTDKKLEVYLSLYAGGNPKWRPPGI